MFDSIQRLVCFEQSHHYLISYNMSPDPTADAPMPLILAPSWHSFRGFCPPDLGAEHHVAANAASCTHGSLWPHAAEESGGLEDHQGNAAAVYWSMMEHAYASDWCVSECFSRLGVGSKCHEYSWIISSCLDLVATIAVLKYQEIHLGSYEDWWLKQRRLVQEIERELHLLSIAGYPQDSCVAFCRRAEKRDRSKKIHQSSKATKKPSHIFGLFWLVR